MTCTKLSAACVVSLVGGLVSVSSGGGLTQADMDDLLAQMTVAEKAGQMTQLSVSTIVDGEELPGHPFTISDEKLRDIVVKHGVGSLFGVWHGPLTVERWRDMVERIQDLAVEETRLGIPVVFAQDSVHGANYLIDGTVFPHNLNMAATWDPDLGVEVGRVTAIETRACGTHWNFSPVADVMRQPKWSRVFETFGEDPLLVGTMASGVIRGMQGSGRPGALASDTAVAATAKHFLGYPDPLSGKDRTPAYIPPTQLRDIYLPPFRMAFESGARTVMINSGEINGVPVHADPRLLIDLLRGELGFEGVAVTDWGDINKLVDVHRVAQDRKEAARMAIEAGVDMSMVAQGTDFTTNVIELVKEGRLSETTLDRSVRRILNLKNELGLFENPISGESSVELIGSPEHQVLSARAARESMVLLRNTDGVLPIAEGSKILVTGPTADDLVPLHGSWTYSWQGHERGWYPADVPTVVEAVRERFGEDHVLYEPGASYDTDLGIAAAAEAADHSDVVVLCLGEWPGTERPGDLTNFNLDRAQLDLARALIATGKPVVMVMVTNRPRTFGEVEEGLAGIIWAGEPGPHGGPAIAGLLAGDDNPSGRLPFSYPRDPASVTAYDRKQSEDVRSDFSSQGQITLFPFGSGMGFAPFEYSSLDVGVNGRTVTVRTTVRNAGDRAGQEVVQVYAEDLIASVTPHKRRLKAFKKIGLKPGESRELVFKLGEADLSMIDRDGMRVFEPGSFKIEVGGLSREIVVE